MAKDTATVIKPAVMEIRLPYSTRLNTSRPRLSVPNQFCPLGGINRRDKSCATGSCGAIKGAKIATTAQNRQMTMPNLNMKFFCLRIRLIKPMGLSSFLFDFRGGISALFTDTGL